MAIMPIDQVRSASRINPVQPVQRPQAAALRFKLPGEQSERFKHRRKSLTSNRVTIHEEGWIREYGILPDGTRILLTEEPEAGTHSFPLPHEPKPRIIEANPDQEVHDPECSMRASGKQLESLLKDNGKHK